MGIGDVAIPKLSGVISDFVALLLRLEPEERTELDSVARQLESDVLDGRVTVKGEPPVYPEISYAHGRGRYPLHRTSSMVSELAPVVLLLRHVIHPGDVLVIEEPEAHLHPLSQVKLAGAIGRAIHAGVGVVMTTHSDYFLDEINNLILGHSLPESRRRSAGYDDQQVISASSVAAYFFRSDKHGHGTVVEPLPVTPAEGVSDEVFGKVAAALYAKSARLQRSTILVR